MMMMMMMIYIFIITIINSDFCYDDDGDAAGGGGDDDDDNDCDGDDDDDDEKMTMMMQPFFERTLRRCFREKIEIQNTHKKEDTKHTKERGQSVPRLHYISAAAGLRFSGMETILHAEHSRSS